MALISPVTFVRSRPKEASQVAGPHLNILFCLVCSADGYLVNVRPALEIEGQVRRTLPPSTLVEVYERKVNAEGLVRLR